MDETKHIIWLFEWDEFLQKLHKKENNLFNAQQNQEKDVLD